MLDDTSLNSPLKITLQVLAGAAGLGAAVTFVGGAMFWLRFDKLELAADQAVALLPERLLLIAGAHALAVPVVFGAASAMLLAIVGAPTADAVPGKFKFALGLVGLVAITAAVVQMNGFDLLPEQAVAYGTILLGIVAIWATAKRSTLRRHIVQVVLIAVVVCGALIAILRTAGAPKMEPVAVLLKDNKAVNGFYIGQTADHVYVAPLPGLGDPGDPFADAQIDRVVELPRAEVLRLALSRPASIAADGSGRQQAHVLLSDLRMQHAGAKPAAAEQVVATVSPETAFAPLVHLDADEPAHPMGADDFLENSWLMWAHDGCPDYSVALRRHVDHPQARRKQIMGAFERSRLAGAGAYSHTPATKDGCRDRGPSFSAGDHTRAFDVKQRPAGLPAKEGFHLDLWDAKRAGDGRTTSEGSQRMLSPIPVYFERSEERHDGRRDLRITYWFFYGLSIPPGPASLTKLVAHEGDWERVSVLLRRGTVAGQYIPVSARYHYHDESRVVPWHAVDRIALGADLPTHPVVFSARGSHASYPRAGRYENVFKAAGRRRFAVHDVATSCPRCPQWRTWQKLVDARAQPWYGFGGAWGRAGTIGGTTGPLGPSRFKIRGLSPAPETTAGTGGPPVAMPTDGR